MANEPNAKLYCDCEGGHVGLGVECERCGLPDSRLFEPIQHSNPAPVTHGPDKPAISLFTGQPDDPNYSATCTVCGAGVIPGGKCPSCGMQAQLVEQGEQPHPFRDSGICLTCSKPAAHKNHAALLSALTQAQPVEASGISIHFNKGHVTPLIVEQGEQAPTNFTGPCSRCMGGGEDSPGVACRQCKGAGRVHYKPSTTAPTEPELAKVQRFPYGVSYNDAPIRYVVHAEDYDAALRENAALKFRADCHVQEIGRKMQQRFDDIATINGLQNQLAQIGAYKSERPEAHNKLGWAGYDIEEVYYIKGDVDPLLDAQDAQIAALKADNAAKDKRIAELSNDNAGCGKQ